MFKLFIERPKLAIIISLFITLIGVIAALQSPIGRYPDVAPVTIEVSTFMDGASAEVITKSVAPEIEKQVNGVSGMDYMQSTSGADGTYTLTITFANGTDPDTANNLVQNRVNLALPELPADASKNGVKVEKVSNGLLIGLAINDPSGKATDTEISGFSGGILKESLQRVNGVSKVDVLGEKKYSMRVWLNPNAMSHLFVNVGDIQAAINAQNKISSAGSVVSNTLEYSVSVDGGLSSAEEFGNIVVRGEHFKKPVLLKDVATIELGAEVYTANAYAGISAGSVLFIYKDPSANAIEVGKAVQAITTSLETDYQIQTVYDATAFVIGAIDNVLETLVLAIIIVALITLVFMQSFRLTLITCAAIPVSLVGTFAAMAALGIDINIISMLGLVMAIGIVVDAAIIVIEAAEHELQEQPQLTPKQAVSASLGKVVSPIIASALVLLAVFAPTIFMSGMTGIIYSEFGIVLSVAVLVSTLVALTLTPALCALFMKPPKKGFIARSLEKLIGVKITVFKFVTHFFVKVPLLSVILLAGALYLTIEDAKELATGMLPDEDASAVFVVGSFPAGTALPVTDAYTLELVEKLQDIEGVSNSISASGFNLITSTADMGSFLLLLNLKPMDSRELSDNQVIEAANAVIAETGVEAFAFKPPVIPELGLVDGVSFVIKDAKGYSPGEMFEISNSIIAQLSSFEDDVALAMTQYAVDKPSIKLEIKRQELNKYGISFADTVTGMQAHFGGSYINTFNMNGRNYKVMVQNSPEYRTSAESLKAIKLSQANGTHISADKIFDISEELAPNFINRFNAQQSVAFDVIPVSATGDVINLINELELPTGISVEFTGASAEEVKAGNQAIIVLALALLVTYMVLVAQYESWLIPAAIMLVVPTAVIGIVYGVIYLQGDINILTQLAAVLLVGMSVRNAILIIEYAKDLREKGMAIKTAAVEAMRLRARAVFMTAFSFGVGLVPLMMADAIGNGAQQALGYASFGGIVSATFIGCIFACVFFVILQNTREWFKPQASCLLASS
ncbi:Hydrophobe/amphiphile efflux-1 family protein [Shewanella piezotolerans WP3]|uniref:Hydrophobe/amphiphile efflux-1 family protein n=1 Tax=Shewanella piezotolerans (strain WP3 / JCM 13877) TaxID=225849 RepID=B8CRZ2_SHEPW|nr:efflux RND transporter permease subunit [Shewanella piezotolerans]ACJ30150.1 Hydrophobe/amphiphile efflux-1 family protein [Shewanella piezotolerans WP3]